jgi:hypothetical protein
MYFLSALTGAVGLEPFPHVPNLEIRALRTIRKLESRVRQFIGDLKGEIDEAELGKRRSVGSKSEIA